MLDSVSVFSHLYSAVISVFLLARLLDHGLHHHGSLFVTFDLAVVGELLHRLHHLQLLVAHGFGAVAAGAGAGARAAGGGRAGAGTARTRLRGGSAWKVLAFLVTVGSWGGVFGATRWRDRAWIFGFWIWGLALSLTTVILLPFPTFVVPLASSAVGGLARSGRSRVDSRLRRRRSGRCVSVQRHAVPDCDVDVARRGRGATEGRVRVAAIAGDQDVAAFGVEVSDGLGLLVLPHAVPDDVAQRVEGLADLRAVRDVLRGHADEDRPLILPPHPFLLDLLGESLNFLVQSFSRNALVSLVLAAVHDVFGGQLFLLQDLFSQKLLAGFDAGDVLDGLGDIWKRCGRKRGILKSDGIKLTRTQLSFHWMACLLLNFILISTQQMGPLEKKV